MIEEIQPPHPQEEQYRAGALVVGPETDSQEELERAKRGLPSLSRERAEEAREPVYDDHDKIPGRPQVPVPFAIQGFDPKAHPEKPRPVAERTSYAPKVVGFNQIMELWAAHEGGRLLRVLNVPGKDDEALGEDDAVRAWEWVARTPGWGPVVHEVMRHLELRKKSWSEWPKVNPVVGKWLAFADADGDETLCYVEHCPWPFITLEAAGEAWRPFYRWLRVRYRREPFYIRTQTVEYV